MGLKLKIALGKQCSQIRRKEGASREKGHRSEGGRGGRKMSPLSLRASLNRKSTSTRCPKRLSSLRGEVRARPGVRTARKIEDRWTPSDGFNRYIAYDEGIDNTYPLCLMECFLGGDFDASIEFETDTSRYGACFSRGG